MSQIKVLGTGCANCKTTLKLIEDVAAEKGVAVQLEKVEDIQAIMGYGVMSTPGVVIDGKVVHAGGVPSREKVAGWLAGNVAAAPTDAKPAGGCCSGGSCG
jgi:small redox-active disulfide protein 2